MGEDPQQLAEHASAEMTKSYDSGHVEIRWVKVQSPLGLDKPPPAPVANLPLAPVDRPPQRL